MTANKSDKLTKLLLTAAGVSVCTFLLIKHHKTIISKFQNAKNLFLNDFVRTERKSFTVHIINDPKDCGSIISTLKEHCKTFNVLGFDCEWITVNNERRKVALIQLCSDRGLCALFRVCKFNKIPLELREILEDPEIIKAGIACNEDAMKLFQDYTINVNSTFDIRFLALLSNHKAEGLAKLSKAVLNIELDKNWRLSCSDWESQSLSKEQIDYAALDSFVAVEIFKKLYNIARPNMNDITQISSFCDQYSDVRFNNKLTRFNLEETDGSNKKLFTKNNRNGDINKILKRSYTKSKNLYDNCFLQAPDGTLLCTCDKRKAEWYISKNLGTEINRTDDNLTVRLNFEPAGMPVGQVGEYYQLRKENECVVCGRKDELIRKNVVPHEYRKYFPTIMKDKTSHDILLLCFHCHQISNISDLKIRKFLEEKCDAPIYEKPENQDELKKFQNLQKTARALLPSRNNIPETRKMELLQIIRDAYPNEVITEDFIKELANEKEPIAIHKTSHGELVVDYYKKNEGIIELEKLFRQHFLDTMHPQFLPNLWDVNHSADRLCIRAIEKRVDPHDLELAGVDEKIIKNLQSTVLNQQTENDQIKVNNNNPCIDDDSDSISFQSAASTLNQTGDDRYFSDTTTIASFYETIRSEDSANLSDFRSFENSCNEDSDSSTVCGSDTEEDQVRY